jgi:hypothetical protein
MLLKLEKEADASSHAAKAHRDELEKLPHRYIISSANLRLEDVARQPLDSVHLLLVEIFATRWISRQGCELDLTRRIRTRTLGNRFDWRWAQAKRMVPTLEMMQKGTDRRTENATRNKVLRTK